MVLVTFDALFIKQFLHRLPEWTKQVYPGGGLEEIANKTFIIETLTPRMARLKYGRLLKEILDEFQRKSDRIQNPDRSVHMYSGHDSTVSALLNMLGLFEVFSFIMNLKLLKSFQIIFSATLSVICGNLTLRTTSWSTFQNHIRSGLLSQFHPNRTSRTEHSQLWY